MIRVYRTAVRWFFHLEAYEVAGLLMSIGALVIFLRYGQRLDEVFSYRGMPGQMLNNVYALMLKPATWESLTLFLVFFTGFLILRQRHSRIPQRISYFSRLALSFIVMMTIYKIIIFYINVFNPFDRDFVIMHIDKILFFGKLPSQWIAPLVNPVFNVIFSTAYMSWFILVYATVLLLYKHSKKAVKNYMTTAIFTFYIGYIGYFFVPAVGPVFMVHYQSSVGALPRLLVLGQSSIARDCFPSLHTGISLVMAANIWKYRRRWSWFYIPVASLIILSTIYLRVHYFLDVAAGTALSVVTIQLSPYLSAAWEQFRARVLLETGMDTTAGLVLRQGWSELARDSR
ncbi:phosphatase PAP2 family protein [Alicyclobacillus sp. SO9]|uniref:phosphatase PAP2 family protein n=1 Tax=Alicyclobacillus sp. SO9 TaxID=2665646 RepID=UPI0018E827DF|nr:phosphatase PAP2 family protein [Alicyclobacillus sp. SO9]QQE80349.1 phosphatase PAP2 family protein [Alicyclobacillus sp. SO9]